MMELKLAPPKIILYRRIVALLGEDPDITLGHDDEFNNINVYVKGSTKAEALEKALILEHTFGNETVNVNIYPSNEVDTPADIYRHAFEGNPVLDDVVVSEGPIFKDATFLLFHKEVVQYLADDIGDANGVHSTLYQYIAEKVLNQPEGVFFNTNVIE